MSDQPEPGPQRRHEPVGITTISAIEHVRRRPRMYLGSTDVYGLHRLFWMALGYGLNAHVAGRADHIAVHLMPDDGVSIRISGSPVADAVRGDDARLIERMMRERAIPYWPLGSRAYHSAGEMAEDLCAVNALSARLLLEMRRAERLWVRQEYECGALRSQDESREGEADLALTFWPDWTILDRGTFDRDLIHDRLRALCCLNPGLSIQLVDHRVATSWDCTFHYPDGLASYVRQLMDAYTSRSGAIVLNGTFGTTRIDVALGYGWTRSRNIRSYVNNYRTEGGGAHLSGFFAGLTHALTAGATIMSDFTAGATLVSDFAPFKNVRLTREDVSDGLAAVISVWLETPRFEGVTRLARTNPELRSQVKTVVAEGLARHFERDPELLQTLAHRCFAPYLHRRLTLIRPRLRPPCM